MSQNYQQIEQNHDILLQKYRDSVFSFNLNDLKFIEYFIGRTGIVINSDSIDFKIFKLLLENPNKNEPRHITIIRYRLQDCWDIYQFNFI